MAVAVGLTISTIVPALIMGILIGILETYFLVKDESSASASSVLGHGLIAFIQVTVLVFFVMHRDVFIALFPSLTKVPFLGFFIVNAVAFRVLIGAIEYVLLEIKGRAFSGAIGGQVGFHETYLHVLIIVLLTAFSPEVWAIISALLPFKI